MRALLATYLHRPAGLAIVEAVAEGNALGKGPVVFALPPPVMRHFLAAAAAGDPGFAALRLNMYRCVRACPHLCTVYCRWQVLGDVHHWVDISQAARLRCTSARQPGIACNRCTGQGL